MSFSLIHVTSLNGSEPVDFIDGSVKMFKKKMVIATSPPVLLVVLWLFIMCIDISASSVTLLVKKITVGNIHSYVLVIIRNSLCVEHIEEI